MGYKDNQVKGHTFHIRLLFDVDFKVSSIKWSLVIEESRLLLHCDEIGDVNVLIGRAL